MASHGWSQKERKAKCWATPPHGTPAEHTGTPLRFPSIFAPHNTGRSLGTRLYEALHQKFGMKKVAHYKEVGFKFGQWLDVGYWQTEGGEIGSPIPS